MSERRPHWSDDLLASVMIHCSDIYQCHAVIAAVEDWHRDRWTGVCESPEEVVRELKQAQAAIQRVREVLDDKDGQLSDEDRAKGSVRRALDGDA